MKKILLLSGNKTPKLHKSLFNAICDNIKNNEIFYAFFNDLEFSIIDNQPSILDSRNEKDLKDYDHVIIRVHHHNYQGEAIACAHYLDKHNQKFWDEKIIHNAAEDKLSQYFIFALNKLRVPDIVYSSNIKNLTSLLTKYQNHLSFPLICKDIWGNKGKNNFLVQNATELEKTLKETSKIKFILQKYIPADHDFRLLTINHKVSHATKRINCNEDDHRNNICLGNKEEKVALTSLGKHILDDANKISRLLRLDLAGIDLIIDPRDNQYFFLEANSSPGFTLKPKENQKEVKELFKIIEEL